MAPAHAPAPIVMLLENCTYPADTRVRNEAETLAADGHRVIVLAPRGPGQRRRERHAGVEVRRYRTVWSSGSAFSFFAEYAVAHTQLLLRVLPLLLREAQVLHYHAPPDTLLATALCARLLGRRVVYDMHDSAPQLFAAKFGASPMRRVIELAQEWAIRSADQVIVTNESQRELVATLVPASRSRITVVRNGPRLSEFPEPVDAMPGVLSRPKLVYIGALDVQDGILGIPELLARPALSTAELTVAGDGPAMAELADRCRKLGVGQRVRLLGRVPHGQVASLIGAADIAIDPAPCNELNHGSTMIKIAEYMAAGRPTVAYSLCETRRTAQDAALYARCGDIDDFALQITSLAEDGNRRLALGRLARARALSLNWGESARALLRVYERLAQ